MKFLAEHGASLSAKDVAGFSPLDYANENDSKEISEFLIEYEAKQQDLEEEPEEPVESAPRSTRSTRSALTSTRSSIPSTRASRDHVRIAFPSLIGAVGSSNIW